MAKKHIVRSGDCITSIAFNNGFYWKTIWDHPVNRNLVRLRQDPNILLVGDEVEIPDLTLRYENGATEQRHRFRQKGVPAKLRLKLLREAEPQGQDKEPTSMSSADRSVTSEDPEPATSPLEDEPRRKVPFVLDIDGRLTQGQTDDDGRIEVSIPPNAQRGTLIVEPGTPNETVTPLRFGTLDPISEVCGVSQRLANLGMGCEPVNEMTPELEAALSAFQEKHGLEVTGEIDEATRQRLEELHES